MSCAAQIDPVYAQMPAWLTALADRVDDLPAAFAPIERSPVDGRRSAVLILFGPGDDGVDVLLTQRAAELRSHPGQVAFPGGTIDPSDRSPEAAALREATEETGLDPSGVQVLARMTGLFLPPSRFFVTPVLAWWGRPSPVAPVDAGEVARVVRVPLEELLDPANRFSVRHPSGIVTAGFAVRGLFVWGFTAALLSHVLAEAGLERPWDATKVESLPERGGT